MYVLTYLLIDACLREVLKRLTLCSDAPNGRVSFLWTQIVTWMSGLLDTVKRKLRTYTCIMRYVRCLKDWELLHNCLSANFVTGTPWSKSLDKPLVLTNVLAIKRECSRLNGVFFVAINRLGRMTDSLARHIKEDIGSEIAALKEAGDKETEAQELRLVRRLNQDKNDRMLELVKAPTWYLICWRVILFGFVSLFHCCYKLDTKYRKQKNAHWTVTTAN